MGEGKRRKAEIARELGANLFFLTLIVLGGFGHTRELPTSALI